MSVRHSRWPWLLLFGLLCLVGCRGRSEAEPQALLKVDGREVSYEEFQSGFAKSLPARQQLSEEERAELERSFLVRVVDRELTLAEAERLAITLSEEEVEAAMREARAEYPAGEFRDRLAERGLDEDAWRRGLAESLLMEKVVREAVSAPVTVSDEEVADYYRSHPDEFSRPEQARARQIVVADEDEGQRVLGELRQGADFAALARRHSLSPDAEEGGDLGFFAQGEMPPEFDAVVWGLPEGQFSDLVKSEYGYHIFQVQERRPALRLTLEAARGDIREQLREAREEQAYQDWLRGLRERAAISINWSLLD